MATGRVTKKAVEAIPVPAPGKRAFLWDDKLKGFGVSVTDRGVRSYVVQFRMGGRETSARRVTIGGHGSPWTADGARQHAADLLEQVRKGIDPIEAEKARQGEALAAKQLAERLAFSDYADRFVERYARARKLRSADDIEAVFARDLKPHFKQKPITTLRRADIQACLDVITARSGAAANKAHAWLRTMLKWAVDRGDLGASPMEGMAPPHRPGQRERVLPMPEIVTVWAAADQQGDPFGALAKLLILTGQRLREVAGMEWSEVDLEARVWTLPSSRTKNGKEHIVPLADSAVAILKALKKAAPKNAVHVLSTNGKTPISGFSKAKRRLDSLVTKQREKQAKASGELAIPVQPWVLHDLRRSFATGAQALGIPVEHTEAVLNHVSGKRGGIVGVYQRYSYLGEKRAALEAWDRAVSLALAGKPEGGNVVKMRGAA